MVPTRAFRPACVHGEAAGWTALGARAAIAWRATLRARTAVCAAEPLPGSTRGALQTLVPTSREPAPRRQALGEPPIWIFASLARGAARAESDSERLVHSRRPALGHPLDPKIFPLDLFESPIDRVPE